MANDKNLIVYKENVFKKFIKFIKGIFSKKEEKIVEENIISHEEEHSKQAFLNGLKEFNENDKLIENVRNDISTLDNMPLEDLKKLNKAIKAKQEYLDQKLMELKRNVA